MAEGNVFKDNGYIYELDRVFSDSGAELLAVTYFYISTVGKATWATGLKLYVPLDFPELIGETIKLILYIPAPEIAEPGNALHNITDTFDVLVTTTGWIEFPLPTPRALPVYSGTGPIWKFGVGFHSGPFAKYMAVSRTNVPSAFEGLWQSEADSFGGALPNKGGGFTYGPWAGISDTARNTGDFNYWNGTDIQVTDVDPFGEDPVVPVKLGTTQVLNMKIGESDVVGLAVGDDRIF